MDSKSGLIKINAHTRDGSLLIDILQSFDFEKRF